MRKGINISHVNIENRGGCDQSQVKKFKKVKSIPKTYQKVITMTLVGYQEVYSLFSYLGFQLHYPG